jgi:THO complex subunit 2
MRQPPPPPPQASLPSPAPSTYCYENLTDEKLASWSEQGRKEVVDHGIQSRDDFDITELSSLFQEFIRSVIEGRLKPEDAGLCVKEVLGPDSKEMIKDSFSFEPHSLFLDTLSVVMDNETGLFRPQLRDFLIATGISPALMRQILDAPFLQQLGLIRETFIKLGIRQSTNLLYRQANYNLLREETEGYSKLTTELFTTSSTEPPSAETVQLMFERIKGLIGTFDLDVGRVLDVTLDVFAAVLIKQFRFFIKLLRVSSWWPRSRLESTSVHYMGGLPNWAMPESEHWMTSEEDEATISEQRQQRDTDFWDRAREVHLDAFFELGGRRVAESDIKRLGETDAEDETTADSELNWMRITKTLPPPGNRVAAQLLGFKLRFYTSNARSKEDILPANLLYLAALLIKVGFVSLVDLYPHLYPLDSGMEALREQRMKELEEKERQNRPGGGMNALLMAGALPDDTLPNPPTTSRVRDANTKHEADAKATNTAASDDKPALDEPLEQKVTLLICLLTIGALPDSLYILGQFPWLPEAYPEILDRIHRILHHSVEKVFQESQPVSERPMECPAKMIAEEQPPGRRNQPVKLSKLPVKRPLRWPFPAKLSTNDNSDYRFYWDEWADNIPVCQTVDDVFTLCTTLLNISGVSIGKDEALLSKLASIGAKSLAEDKSQQNLDRWQDLLRRLLVPALSLTKANAPVVNAVWGLLSQYPIHARYAIYAEWYEGQISRFPAMKAAFARTRLETLGTMKRVSLTNLSDMAKALAKTSYSSPGIVFKVALDQIEAYANLIEAFVECAKYFTNLAYDVLVWSLMSSLGGKQRSRTQETSILLTSKWLQALSKFSGRVFKRYSIMDPTPVIRYVNDQLYRGNSTDLIILKDLISSMGGVVQTVDFTDDQIMAMSGGEVLRRQTLINFQDKRFDSAKSGKRLMQALIESRLAGPLLINISQYRQSAIFNIPEDEAHIKYLSSTLDDSHQILIQYLDLLRSNLDPQGFDALVPTISQLMDDYGLDVSLAFLIGRDSLAHYMFPTEKDSQKQLQSSADAPVDGEGDVSMAESKPVNGTPVATEPDEKMAVDQTDGDDRNSVAAQLTNGQGRSTPVQILEIVQPIIESIQASAPSTVWQSISPEFYVIFWALQLGDLASPGDSYKHEHTRIVAQSQEVMRDRTDMSRSGMNKKEAKKARLKGTADSLLEEMQNHQEKITRNRVYMMRRFKSWFPGSLTKVHIISDAILEQCLLPRLVLSASDAEYCHKMIKFLHERSAPNFKLMSLYDRLFNANRLRSMIFTCTVREAEHLGRFLKCVLRDLSVWHKDKAAYEKEAFYGRGTQKDRILIGFATAFDDEGKPKSFIEHDQFKDLLYGWHKNLNTALKSCLGGMEWMHIRNAITLLKGVIDHFPAVDFMASQFSKQLKTITDREAASKPGASGEEGHRVDLSVAAQTALSELQRRKAKWVLVQAFRPNTVSSYTPLKLIPSLFSGRF